MTSTALVLLLISLIATSHSREDGSWEESGEELVPEEEQDGFLADDEKPKIVTLDEWLRRKKEPVAGDARLSFVSRKVDSRGRLSAHRNRELVGIAVMNLASIGLRFDFIELSCDGDKTSEPCRTSSDTMDSFVRLFIQTKKMSEPEPHFLLANPHSNDDRFVQHMILKSLAAERKHYAKPPHARIQKEQDGEYLLCYADESDDFGRSVCLLAALAMEKQEHVAKQTMRVFASRQEVVDALSGVSEQVWIGGELDAGGLVSVRCSGGSCDASAYWEALDDSDAISAFLRRLREENFIEFGSGEGWKEGGMDHWVFLLYDPDTLRGPRSRRAFIRALVERLKGTVKVGTLDVSKASQDLLNQFSTVAERRLGLYFHPYKFMDGERFTNEDEKFVPLKGEPVKQIATFFHQSYQSRHHGRRLGTEEENLGLEDDPRVQDDEVEILLYGLRNRSCFFCPPKLANAVKVEAGNWKELTERETFAILAWLKVDTLSRAAFHITVEASKKLYKTPKDSNLGVLACHDWPDVCQKLTVDTWPRLLVFKSGALWTEYEGVWDPQLLAEFIHAVSGPPMGSLKSEAETVRFASGNGFLLEGRQRPAQTIGFFQDEDNCKNEKDISCYIKTAFDLLARQLHGSFALASVNGKLAKKMLGKYQSKAKLPQVITFRPTDPVAKQAVFKFEGSPKPALLLMQLRNFVLRSSVPSILPLNDANFVSAVLSGKPLLLCLASDEEEAAPLLSNLAKGLQKSQQLFQAFTPAFLQRKRFLNLTDALLSKYNIAPTELPIITVVDMHKRLVWVMREKESGADVAAWALRTLEGKMDPDVKLEPREEPERPLMYDFRGKIWGKATLSQAEWKKRQEEQASTTDQSMPPPSTQEPPTSKSDSASKKSKIEL